MIDSPGRASEAGVSLYAVGKIIGCFGVHGDVKVRPMTHSPRRLTSLRDVAIGNSDQDTKALVVAHVVLKARFALMRFQGISDRDAAELLVGKYVFVRDSEIEKPQPGSYFIHDLIGCEVRSTEGRFLGRVESISKLPAHDVLEVRDGSRLSMIPAVKEFLIEVNLRDRKIVIGLIDGLIEE
ncbi:MAG TPA: ribosome maturation factor RimM [Bacteroidota bacterium]|nr:ribosome maturation factor RimM [Bacteroidota bacterium]